MTDDRIRTWLYQSDDGSQTLVTHYPAVNLTTIAHRPNSWATWGPPATMEDRTWTA
jgi:hypothetical protein